MAQTIQTFRILVTLGLAAVATACSPVHETKSSSGSGSSNILSERDLSASASAFSNSLYEELKTNCQECHGADDNIMPITGDIQQTHDLVDQLGYVNLATPAQSMIVTLSNGGHQGVTAIQATAIENAIQSWANQLNVIGEEGPAGGVVSLSAMRANIFTPKCAGCHGGANPAAGLDFTDFALVQQRVNTADPTASVLYQRITSQDPAVRMPRNDPNPLPDDEIADILAWITAGAPNN